MPLTRRGVLGPVRLPLRHSPRVRMRITLASLGNPLSPELRTHIIASELGAWDGEGSPKTAALARTVALCAVAFVVASCVPILAPRSFETAVANSGGAAYVVGVQVPEQFHFVDRFYAAPPNLTVIVDTAGEANPPTGSVRILTPGCDELFVVTRDFSMGAIITVTDEAPPTVRLQRTQSAPREHADELMGSRTCEEAAANF